ncbi:TIGR03016 family PEP-CTERM system-associated outer membrane protein [Rubrivivax gelatinosus]|uniref:Uncharacterized protein (PEP-CTERM system associated) n=1 Tax=Rubrivivax gelatinosus TaxID=28068 RepID=A0A4R2MJU2_RUBGE|nr:TIGR03016 family PEP-CTERM system-associated outer membrane protein [Rubrivivax gelatinosus]MBK1686121.1 TIGR03016 family PEP-CTERM system-associated outer membrane protein [Rubrivivax gelatinosus]TCP05615.1 uncharacterized protein (PEP-CTERM system associated) [Rubrivivax gelatinosus]
MKRPTNPAPRPHPVSLAVFGLVAMLAAPALAQERAGIVVERSIDLQQTLTDNGRLSDDDRKSEAITEIRPGIRASGRSGRVEGSLDYRLDLVQYARESGRSTYHHQLNADGAAELVPRHVFLDASASVSQQSISAFGQQSSASGVDNDNRTDVATVSVSPSARALLGGKVQLSAVANWDATRAKDSTLGDRTDWDATVQAGATHGIFGWNLSGTRQTNAYNGGDRYISDNATATLSVSLTPRLQVFGRHGEDRSDILGSGEQKSSTNGWGLTWLPSVRTRVSAQADRHFYGNSHSFSLSHRFRRAHLTYTDTRGVSGQNNETLGTLRQLYLAVFNTCMAVLNDSVRCTTITRNSLGLDGLDSLGFLNSAPSLQRSQTLTLAVQGVRNTLTLAATSSKTERLGDQQYDAGDLAIVPRVRQYGLTAGLGHRLTPKASMSLTATLLKTLDEDTQPGTELRRLELSVSNELGARTQGTLAVRRVWFDSETNPYRESAIVGSLNYRF